MLHPDVVKMPLFKLNKRILSRYDFSKRFITALRNDEEYTAVPQYPPILDLSYEKKLERKKEAIHEEIKAVKTVEEKQIKLNMPRYYGFKTYMLTEDYIPYNNLTLAQHVTRTHLTINNKLPDFYNSIQVDNLVSSLKSEIEEALLLEIDGYQRSYDLKTEDLSKIELEDVISSSVVSQTNRIILNKLTHSHTHLSNVQVDWDPRIESSWYAGGMMPPEAIKKKRRGLEWSKQFENDPVDRLMVYIGSPSLALRSELPLNPIIPYSESENATLEVPFFHYDPRVFGIKTEYRHMSNIPGFWPGDPHRFGFISFHKRGHLLTRERFQDAQDDKEALHRQGILASFGWLSAQANFLGFTMFNDLTYPLVTQTVITSGKLWSFYAYQLNTIILHSKHIKENPKRNICWATEELMLFEEVKDGKIIGLNDDVLKLLLKFYVNAPESKLGVNLTPYLSNEEKVIADYEDDEKREWLEREYKFLVANRPRSKLPYEIYAWEKIYKIDNKTRPMEKRLRPFELFIEPYKRRLDERIARYIPRKLRPDLPRSKGRYAKEFFP